MEIKRRRTIDMSDNGGREFPNSLTTGQRNQKVKKKEDLKRTTRGTELP